MSGAGWWHRASTEQRLAQLDGGIECGLTARQIAVISQTTRHAVLQYAHIHRRPLAASRADASGDGGAAYQAKLRRERARRQAYQSGEPVDFWRESKPATDELAEVILE